jgi:hypothetical protein
MIETTTELADIGFARSVATLLFIIVLCFFAAVFRGDE